MNLTRKPALLLAVIWTLTLPLLAAQRPEADILADLASAKPATVIRALQQLEKGYPAEPAALTRIKALLSDPRPAVQRKAARVLGAVHAPVNDGDVTRICSLLAGNKAAREDGLKALRGLNAPGAVPRILPLLKNPDDNTKRDACRTLAVLGGPDLIPNLKPLLQDPSPAVQRDAGEAIYVLQHK